MYIHCPYIVFRLALVCWSKFSDVARRMRYQERAAGANIVITLVNMLEATDKSAQRVINDIYDGRDHSKITEFY